MTSMSAGTSAIEVQSRLRRYKCAAISLACICLFVAVFSSLQADEIDVKAPVPKGSKNSIPASLQFVPINSGSVIRFASSRNARQSFLGDAPDENLLPNPNAPISFPASTDLNTRNTDRDFELNPEQSGAPSQPKVDDDRNPNKDQNQTTRNRIRPYIPPSLHDPAERVVPLPVVPAPSDFQGFGDQPKSDEGELPQPRRIFALPSLPGTPSFSQPNNRPDQGVPGRFSDSNAFPSLERRAAPEYSWASGPTILGTYNPPMPSTRRKAVRDRFADSQPTPGASLSTSYESATAPFLEQSPPSANMQYHSRIGQRLSSMACIDGDPRLDNHSALVPYQAEDFCPIPSGYQPLDACREIQTYAGKFDVDVQRPWVEWWRPFYTGGMYAPGIPVFSDNNLLQPSLIVYGDYRTGVGIHRNNGAPVRNLANRLNLDWDLRLTGTERFHMFTGPLDHNGKFTRLDFSNGQAKFIEELDFQPDTAFFEGDLGAMFGGLYGLDAPFDLPFTFGLVPLLFQNGIWMEDAIAGFAVGRSWQHNRELNWANYDMTFFAGFNQVTSPAFNNNNTAAQVFGTAWFVEAYEGYIEMDYAFLNDTDSQGRSYHNAALAYTRRYFGRVSNSIRLIGNAGQNGARVNRTADGALLIMENSLVSSQPSTVVPYCNLFLGYGTPQSVARAGGAGGVLRNTGINFESDGLTGYPTLDATGSSSYGGAAGINLLSADFRQQMVFEFAALDTYGDPALSKAAGAQYAVGARWQRALNNRFILRADVMNGWFDNAPDIYGMRTEFRWKF